MRRTSVPRHRTSSRKIGPVPAPSAALPMARASNNTFRKYNLIELQVQHDYAPEGVSFEAQSQALLTEFGGKC